MNNGKRNALLVTVIYLAILCFLWIWFQPDFVSERVHDRISIGASASDVENVFQVKPYDFPSSAYCGKNGPSSISRIALDEVIRVPLLPLPVLMVTTTTFCFSQNDKLVGINTERWFDELWNY